MAKTRLLWELLVNHYKRQKKSHLLHCCVPIPRKVRFPSEGRIRLTTSVEGMSKYLQLTLSFRKFFGSSVCSPSWHFVNAQFCFRRPCTASSTQTRKKNPVRARNESVLQFPQGDISPSSCLHCFLGIAHKHTILRGCSETVPPLVDFVDVFVLVLAAPDAAFEHHYHTKTPLNSS